MMIPCYWCRGSGVVSLPCPTCRGSGELPDLAELHRSYAIEIRAEADRQEAVHNHLSAMHLRWAADLISKPVPP